MSGILCETENGFEPIDDVLSSVDAQMTWDKLVLTANESPLAYRLRLSQVDLSAVEEVVSVCKDYWDQIDAVAPGFSDAGSLALELFDEFGFGQPVRVVVVGDGTQDYDRLAVEVGGTIFDGIFGRVVIA